MDRTMVRTGSPFHDCIKIGRIATWRYGTVYAVAFLLLVTAGVGPSERTDAYIVLSALLIVGAVWQSAGLTLARIHMLIDDISLEAPKRRPPEVSDEPPPEVITGF